MSLASRLCFSIALGLFVRTSPAQCRDPKPPRGGFQVAAEANLPIKYSDLYETRANVLYPSATPGSCGWPLVVFVHGLGADRSQAGGEAFRLASLGYFVVAFDVRGQGAGVALNRNRGSRLWELNEWIDLAEVIQWARRRYSIVDKTRVAVYGDSQGGIYSWAAAAYSGRKLPPNRRWQSDYPTISCVVPRYFGPYLPDFLTTSGEHFHWHVPNLAFTPNATNLLLDDFYKQFIGTHLDRDDPGALRNYLDAISGKDFIAELLQTRVPILTIQAWQDVWTDNNAVIDILQRLPAATPRRIYMSTGLHGTPVNARQGWQQIVMTELWLRRWLKREGEAMEFGPRFLMATLPSDPAEYADSASLWRHRGETSWPPPATQRRYYLRSSGRLLTSQPTSEADDVIQHVVRDGFDARDFHAVAGEFSAVQQRIPLRELRYETATLTADTEIAGIAKVSLTTSPSERNFSVAARLESVTSRGAVRVLATGGRGYRLTTTPGRLRVDLDLSAISAVVAAGSKIRLVLSNHHIVQPNDAKSYRLLPVFSDYDLRIRKRSTDLSFVDLPVRRRVSNDLTTSETTISITAPGTQRLSLRSASEWSGSIYLVFLTLSGQGPPQRLPGGESLWLDPDIATVQFSQALNGPVLPNLVGILDGSGASSGNLNFDVIKPLPSFLVGTSIHLGSVIYRTQTQEWAASGPLRLMFR